MMSHRSCLLLILACLLAFAFAPVASAQSAADLERENAELRQRVSELEKELETAQKNITLLQNEVRRLRSGRPSSGSPTSTPSKSDPSTSSDQFSSPDAFAQAIRASYAKSFDEIDASNPRERASRLRALRGWSNDTKRSFSGKINWTVTLDTSEGDGINRQSATFRTANGSGQPTGDPFELRLNSRLLRDLRDAPAGTLWALEGELTPRITTSPNRTTADDAGDDIFVGAFAELSLDIKVDSLTQK